MRNTTKLTQAGYLTLCRARCNQSTSSQHI